MKSLNNHLILFDAECPMCSVYTRAMVATGILDANGRAAYQDVPVAACPMVNRQRAVNEIAIINQATGEVTYGIHSLFKIFATAMPLLKPLFSFAPFVWVMARFYAFISYNRRVIIPAPVSIGGTQLQPTFRLKYRLLYLLFTWAVTSFILTAYVHLMKGPLPQGSVFREYMVCGGQIFFQGFIVWPVAKDKTWNYLGNMMTISFAGALLLLPGLIVNAWLTLNPLIYVLYFLLVAGLMFLEHVRRSKLLQLGWVLTISWVCYRLAVLLLIFLAK
jgi:hypothetical protein